MKQSRPKHCSTGNAVSSHRSPTARAASFTTAIASMMRLRSAQITQK